MAKAKVKTASGVNTEAKIALSKSTEREEHWKEKGFIYFGTGNIEIGMKKNPQMKDGDPVEDIRKIDVLLKPAEHNFWFSDPLLQEGKPFMPGAAGNLAPKFRAQLERLTCLPDVA